MEITRRACARVIKNCAQYVFTDTPEVDTLYLVAGVIYQTNMHIGMQWLNTCNFRQNFPRDVGHKIFALLKVHEDSSTSHTLPELDARSPR